MDHGSSYCTRCTFPLICANATFFVVPCNSELFKTLPGLGCYSNQFYESGVKSAVIGCPGTAGSKREYS